MPLVGQLTCTMQCHLLLGLDVVLDLALHCMLCCRVQGPCSLVGNHTVMPPMQLAPGGKSTHDNSSSSSWATLGSHQGVHHLGSKQTELLEEQLHLAGSRQCLNQVEVPQHSQVEGQGWGQQQEQHTYHRYIK